MEFFCENNNLSKFIPLCIFGKLLNTFLLRHLELQQNKSIYLRPNKEFRTWGVDMNKDHVIYMQK